MAGIIVALLLASGMLTMIWIVMRRRPQRIRALDATPGGLTAAERTRLYRRLGIDPYALARHRRVDMLLSSADQRRRR